MLVELRANTFLALVAVATQGEVWIALRCDDSTAGDGLGRVTRWNGEAVVKVLPLGSILQQLAGVGARRRG